MSAEVRRRTVLVGWREPLLAAHPADAGGDADPQAGSAGGRSAGAPGPRELTLVSLREDGVTGHGEEAFLPGYAGVTRAEAEAAALDIAGWDLRGRRERLPLWRLLGASGPAAVEVNATIGAEQPGRAAAAAAAAAERGFRTVKVKVGVGDDRRRVAAVRAAVGPEIAVRLDANGAWGVEQAVAALSEMAAWAPELCEEPVHGAAALAAVARRVPQVPIVADESAAELLGAATGPLAGGFRQGAAPGRCDGVCLKVARGGLTRLLADARRARARGYRVYLASTLDGPLGIAAALHAAAVIAPDRPCGLATLDRFDRPPPLTPVAGTLSPPPGPGLGDRLLDWYDRG